MWLAYDVPDEQKHTHVHSLVSVYVSALQTVNLSLIFVFKIHLQINLNIKETG